MKNIFHIISTIECTVYKIFVNIFSIYF